MSEGLFFCFQEQYAELEHSIKNSVIYIQRRYYIFSLFKYRDTVTKPYRFHLPPNEEQNRQVLPLCDKIFKRTENQLWDSRMTKSENLQKSWMSCGLPCIDISTDSNYNNLKVR